MHLRRTEKTIEDFEIILRTRMKKKKHPIVLCLIILKSSFFFIYFNLCS